ncbi:type II CAAX prenyl endopeptidase Rce1 family protein [Novosphingobium sp. FKTRR1]|uniref:CPBP family glutamic-type intramembrane protease n=1 Tax=Novosphingobium sp. FKTRR1 TaxID=2879118 RepID=UPI001CF0433F|nr:CPBP family glutamic-type intramembrane protease [Novosphingobium sp. FKTRR1]
MSKGMFGPIREFAAWLARPQVLHPAGFGEAGAWRRWSALLALHLAVLLGVLLPLMAFWQHALGLPQPEAFLKFPRGVLLVAVVIAAPIGEEIAFRGWLTGRPRSLWLLACGVLAAALLAAVSLHWHEAAASLGFVALVPVAALGWWWLRGLTEPPGWFVALFPAAFAASTLAFGLSHLTNYPVISLALLPMVLPQLWAGLVLGFVRMRIGLPASMLIHAIANAVAVGFALASS